MRLLIFVCIMATAADAAAIGLAVATDPSTKVLGLLLIAHLAASQLFSQSVVNILPPHYRQKGRAVVLFVFGLVVFVPVLAMIAFLASLVPALCRQRAVGSPALWLHPREAHLPTRAPEPRGKCSLVQAGSLAGTLQNAPDPKAP